MAVRGDVRKRQILIRVVAEIFFRQIQPLIFFLLGEGRQGFFPQSAPSQQQQQGFKGSVFDDAGRVGAVAFFFVPNPLKTFRNAFGQGGKAKGL